MSHTPEKLNLWDRVFNRYRKEVIEETTEIWHETYKSKKLVGSEYKRRIIKYRVIDRVTGSETITREYLD